MKVAFLSVLLLVGSGAPGFILDAQADQRSPHAGHPDPWTQAGQSSAQLEDGILHRKQVISSNRAIVPIQLDVDQPFIPSGCEGDEDYCEMAPDYPDPELIKSKLRDSTTELEAAVLFDKPELENVQVQHKAAVPIAFGADATSRLRPGVAEQIQTDDREMLLQPAVEGVLDIAKSGFEYIQETPVCDSVVSYVYPQSAKNINNQWRFVVNLPGGEGSEAEDNYVQAVQVEKCLKNGESCNIYSSGSRTKCRQKYNYRKLVALSEIGEKYIDSFRFPSCCVCYKIDSFGYSGLELLRTQGQSVKLRDDVSRRPTNYEQTIKDLEEQIEVGQSAAEKRSLDERRQRTQRRQSLEHRN